MTDTQYNMWRPWCFKCQENVANHDWRRGESLYRRSVKCSKCEKRCHAPSILFRNILLVPLVMLAGVWLSIAIKPSISDPDLSKYADAIAPVLGAAVALFAAFPSWIRWIIFCRQIRKPESQAHHLN